MPRAVLLTILLSACAPEMYTQRVRPVSLPVHTYVLLVSCETCDAKTLDVRVAAMMEKMFPCARRVPAQPADLTIDYKEGDSVICLDCGEVPLLRDWWWQVTFYAGAPAAGHMVGAVRGDVNKMRGRPARFAERQLLAYFGERDPCSPVRFSARFR